MAHNHEVAGSKPASANNLGSAFLAQWIRRPPTERETMCSIRSGRRSGHPSLMVRTSLCGSDDPRSIRGADRSRGVVGYHVCFTRRRPRVQVSP